MVGSERRDRHPGGGGPGGRGWVRPAVHRHQEHRRAARRDRGGDRSRAVRRIIASEQARGCWPHAIVHSSTPSPRRCPSNRRSAGSSVDLDHLIAAFDIAPSVRFDPAASIVTLESEANIAIGHAPVGARGSRSGHGADSGGRPGVRRRDRVILVGKDNHRREWTRALIDAVRDGRPDRRRDRHGVAVGRSRLRRRCDVWGVAGRRAGASAADGQHERDGVAPDRHRHRRHQDGCRCHRFVGQCRRTRSASRPGSARMRCLPARSTSFASSLRSDRHATTSPRSASASPAPSTPSPGGSSTPSISDSCGLDLGRELESAPRACRSGRERRQRRCPRRIRLARPHGGAVDGLPQSRHGPRRRPRARWAAVARIARGGRRDRPHPGRPVRPALPLWPARLPRADGVRIRGRAPVADRRPEARARRCSPPRMPEIALAREVRSRLVDNVAAAVRLLVLTVDVDDVVIGGGLSSLGEVLLADVRARARAAGPPIPSSWRRCSCLIAWRWFRTGCPRRRSAPHCWASSPWQVEGRS